VKIAVNPRKMQLHQLKLRQKVQKDKLLYKRPMQRIKKWEARMELSEVQVKEFIHIKMIALCHRQITKEHHLIQEK
jgi:phage baseplate assembly protein W